ncbi:hypothetical protein DAPPUDRAFT_248881 [Daphnia pulex]|uniref:Uncharacterized protein n=1 Tax=Daphnia pulex TaxID=6669 RepID=E9GVD7_DAPPU|nr:hypothetical protein DAPPUDRAFT_248881 [Daphnia pulex]|eukprot:EFX76550.1 hypothetical protein DAPPUDRAFT_248881 [Daphnia pulex]
MKPCTFFNTYGVPLEIESKNDDNNETHQPVKPDEPEQQSNEAADEQDGRQNNNNAVLESRSDVSSLSRSSSGSDRSSLSESREDTSVIHTSITVEGTTQEATDDDSFVQSDVVSSSEIVSALPHKERPPLKERSRSPSPQIEKTDPVKEVEEEEDDDESILSPNRKVKGDATGDSGTGTGGTSIPSTPDSVFLERTLDRLERREAAVAGRAIPSLTSKDNEVVLRSKPGRSLSTVSNGTTINSEADTTSEREPTPVRRAPRTNEEMLSDG